MERTTPFKNYIKPGKKLVHQVAKEVKFENNYSYDFIKDIANYLSYPGEKKEEAFTLPSSWDIKVDSKKFSNKKEEREEKDKIIDYHKNVQRFIKEMNFNKVTGETPLEKAFNTVSMLSKIENHKNGQENNGHQLPIFQKKNNNELKRTTEELLEKMELIEKIKPGSFMEKALGLENTEGLLAGVKANKLKKEYLILLNKISLFNSYGKIAAKKKIKVEENEFSKEKKYLQISKYSEISKVSILHSLMPTFDYKFITKQLSREKGVNVEESKQCLVLLIDDSGSMQETEKIQWIKALLLNRCEEVSKGNAELYICTFEVELDPNWIVVRTKEEALDVWNKFRRYFQLERGGTNMQKSIEQAIKIINSGKIPTEKGIIEIERVRPQICIINDGQDHIEKGWIPSIETHGFILEGSHGGMRKFCTRSGGTYQEFNSYYDEE